ncbi:MAG: DUF6498-containing protein [Burkholderiaceae bacterium]
MGALNDEDATRRRIDIALAVIAAAMIVYGVLVFGWSVFVVIALFWFENVVIGVLNVAKMLITGARLGSAGMIAAVALAAFFSVHYGLFTVVHGVFVVMLFGQQELGATVGGLFAPLGRMLAYLLTDRDGWFAAAGIAVVHLSAFVRWITATRTRSASLPGLMFAPYSRIVILHVSVIGSGILVGMLKLPLLGALLLVGLKLVFDIVANKLPPPNSAPSNPSSFYRLINARKEDAAGS